MTTQELWKSYSDKLFFFILKRVKNEETTGDILQNTFLKIHRNLHTLKDNTKVKAWVHQIARNELINYVQSNSKKVPLEAKNQLKAQSTSYQDVCCFDNFIQSLPKIYKDVIKLIYLKGKSQRQTAELLNLSLANVKARVRRGKSILKKQLSTCCKFEINYKGQLVGEPNCACCTDTFINL